MFYTYILISKNGRRTYTGHTANLARRFNEHNNGLVISSRHYRPYEVLHVEEFETLKEAKHKEQFYKSSTGRYHLKRIVRLWNKSRASFTNI